jgi:hypothetical protein
VTFLSVLTKTKKEIAEISKNILPTRKGEKSKILMGQIKQTIPKTKEVVMMTDPITSPTIIQSCDFLAACKQKESSGKAVPKPTIKVPMNVKGTLRKFEKNKADLTIPCADNSKRKIEKRRRKKFFRKKIKVNGSFIPL